MASSSSAADVKGYHIEQGVESDCIQQIDDEISNVSYCSNVVGINAHLERVKSLLEIEIRDVRTVGIWGMGGVGKTTIARAIFDTLSHLFEATCFLADIKEKEKRNELHSLQNTLLSELLRKEDNYYVNCKYGGQIVIRSRLRSKKVLIVLDDIDHRDHLDFLAGCPHWFGSGSRIIATTRDKHLMGKNDAVYEVTTLADPEALQVFNNYAFKGGRVDECFKELTWEVLSHAKGLPLALRVWGSLLYNRDITEWRSIIADIRKNSNSEIVDKLKISYNRLEPTQQNMFLDLACFLRGLKQDKIKEILESCDFEVDIGFRILIERSLVFISDKDTIEMHDLIQEMGQRVVNMQKNPGKRSRLWLTEDIEEVMDNNTGTEEIEAIWALHHEKINFTKDAMINMRSLRILHILWKPPSHSLNGSIEYLSNKLRWLVWINYPWKSLPPNFEPKRLVHLHLYNSSLHYFWTERKHLPFLREIDLSHSTNLKRTPDFSGMPNLEYLCLRGCTNLEEVSPSLGCCIRLILLCLSSCSKLKRLPERIGDLQNLEKLHARNTAISQPPSSITQLTKLKYLTFRKSHLSKVHFVFPPVGEGLRSLEVLDLTNCNLIDGGLPEDIGCLSSLNKLYLEGNKFEYLPRSIDQLVALRSLHLTRCYNLKELRELPPQLYELNAEWGKDSIYNSFAHAHFQNLSSAADSSSGGVFTIEYERPTVKIPSWFRYKGRDKSVSVNLPENWYIHDNFLGFAVCYNGILVRTTVELLPLSCNDGDMSWMTMDMSFVNYSKSEGPVVHFFFVPLAALWDVSKANGKTPNDYGHIRLCFSGKLKKYGLRLLYKDEPELESEGNDECEPESEDYDIDEPEHESLIQREENNDEHHDSAIKEACCFLGHCLKSMSTRLLRIFSNRSRG